MKITICASISSTYEINEIAKKLRGMGHEVKIPMTSQTILDGELTLEDFKKEKGEDGDGSSRKIKHDVIRRYYNIIKDSDAILVLNIDKNGIANYIGGNTFLEMGFAYVLEKRIYLLNPIPDMMYLEELKTFNPIILEGDLSKINP